MTEFRVLTDFLYLHDVKKPKHIPCIIAEDVGKGVRDRFFDEQLDIAVRVITEQKKQKRPIALSKDEQFALAFCAGVKTETRFDKDSNTLHITTEKVGIAWDGERFLIATEPKELK